MKKRKVMMWKQLPSRLPIQDSCVLWLMLDRFQAVGWVKGAAWTSMAIVWAAVIYGFCQEEPTLLKELE